MIFIIGLFIGIFVYLWYSAVKRENEAIEDRKLERKMQKEQQQRITDLYQEREKNPILCKVCTKKNKKKTYFEGLAWYHCPICSGHGFASIYGSDGRCTACANLNRFGSVSGY